MEKLERTTLVDRIVERLRADILDGKHLPGASLPPERDLATRFGVNRTSVKHALMKLEQLGFIEIRHGIGSIVRDYVTEGGVQLLEHLLVKAGEVDFDLMRDVLEVRVLMGGAIAYLAARHPAAATALAEVLARGERAVADPSELQDVDMEFFATLAAATGNRAFLLMLNSVAVAYGRHREEFVHAFTDGPLVLAGLRRILAAVEKGSPEEARRAAEKHLRTNSDAMLARWATAGRKAGIRVRQPTDERARTAARGHAPARARKAG